MSVLAIIAALLIEQWRPLGERKERVGHARRLGGLARARLQRRRAPPRPGGLAGGGAAAGRRRAGALRGCSTPAQPLLALSSTSRCSTSRSASASSATTSPISSSRSRRATSSARARCSSSGAAPRACAHARGSDPPGDRGGAARRAPPRLRRAALVPAAARAERRDPLPPRGLPRRALEAPQYFRPLCAGARSPPSTTSLVACRPAGPVRPSPLGGLAGWRIRIALPNGSRMPMSVP